MLAVGPINISAAPFHIEKFLEWVEPRASEFAPAIDHATFAWSKAMPSIVLVVLGFVVSLAISRSVFGGIPPSKLKGLTERNAVLSAGHHSW
ncbi:MAG: hypothetical protein R2713_21125 [Ilumatobacteraceae bacterium]